MCCLSDTKLTGCLVLYLSSFVMGEVEACILICKMISVTWKLPQTKLSPGLHSIFLHPKCFIAHLKWMYPGRQDPWATLFHSQDITKSGFWGLHTENTDGEKEYQEYASLRAQDERKAWWGVGQPAEKWEASIFLSRTAWEGGLSLLELLSGFLSSSFSTWRRLYSHPHNKLLPTSNQLYPWPVYGPPRVQWPSATVSKMDPSIANLPAFRSVSSSSHWPTS